MSECRYKWWVFTLQTHMFGHCSLIHLIKSLPVSSPNIEGVQGDHTKKHLPDFKSNPWSGLKSIGSSYERLTGGTKIINFDAKTFEYPMLWHLMTFSIIFFPQSCTQKLEICQKFWQLWLRKKKGEKKNCNTLIASFASLHSCLVVCQMCNFAQK